MATDVTVRILGNARQLLSELRKAEKEIRNLAKEAEKAGKESGDALGGEIVKGVSKAGIATKVLGGLIGGVALTGAMAVATTAANFLGDALIEAFAGSEKAANDAAKAYEKAFEAVTKIRGGIEDLGFATKQDALDGLRRVNEELGIANEAVNRLSQRAVTAFGPAVSLELLTENTKKLTAEEQRVVAELETEKARLLEIIDLFDKRARAASRARGTGATGPPAPDRPGVLPFERGNFEAADIARRDTGALDDLEKTIDQAIKYRDEKERLIATLQRQRAVEADTNRAAFEASDLRQRLLQSEIDIEEEVEAQIRAVNAAFDETLNAVDFFATDGVSALADIALGFEKIQDIGQNVANIVRGLARDLIVAAAKAALLTAFTGGAGAVGGATGFGGFFKSFLGLTPFASGGIVTGSTPALVGERGPEAIIPLSQLGSFGSQRLEVVPAVLPGGDILIGLREANASRVGRGGRINL